MEKATILIVDDCPIMCQFYALFLEKKYKAHTATDPVRALQLIEAGFRPELIVSDLNMPTLHGVKLIEAIRAIMPEVPVLVVSGNDGIGKRAALNTGADKFLAKPFHPADLSLHIGELLEQGKEKKWYQFFTRVA